MNIMVHYHYAFCRSKGYLKRGQLEDATFSCLHRNTLKPICAIPCNGHDDMCLDYADEADCKKSTSFIEIGLILALFVVSSLVLGEVVFRVENPKNEVNGDLKEGNSELDEMLNLLQMRNKEQFLDQITKDNLKPILQIIELKFVGREKAEMFQLIHKSIYQKWNLEPILGTNALSAQFIEALSPNFLTKLKWKLAGTSNATLIHVVSYLAKVSLYYLDTFKDLFFIIFLQNIAQEVTNSSFPSHILALLILIIVINELSKITTLIIASKRTLKLRQKTFILMISTFPFIPATCI